MSTIVTRAGKGSKLSWAEADANFTNLNTDKLETSSIHAATSKTTPVDADELPLVDSADSFSLKKLTWANVKAALKTYLDTLYLGISGNAASATNATNVTGTIASGVTGTTQAAGDSSTKIATTAFVQGEVGTVAASTAEMEAATSNTVAATPGNLHSHPGVAKAWAVISFSGGTPSLSASYNVSGITDNGVGDITITFTTPFSSTLYAVTGLAYATLANDSGDLVILSRATGSCRIGHRTSVATLAGTDGDFTVVFFGDQ